MLGNKSKFQDEACVWHYITVKTTYFNVKGCEMMKGYILLSRDCGNRFLQTTGIYSLTVLGITQSLGRNQGVIKYILPGSFVGEPSLLPSASSGCQHSLLVATSLKSLPLSLWVCEWLNTHSVKFTTLTVLKCIVTGIQYSHRVVPPSPPSIFRTFSFSQNETLCPLNSNSPFPLPPAPGNHHCTFCLYELDHSRALV